MVMIRPQTCTELKACTHHPIVESKTNEDKSMHELPVAVLADYSHLLTQNLGMLLW